MFWYIKQLLTIGYEMLPLLTNAIALGKSCPCSGGDCVVVVVAAATAAAADDDDAAVVVDESLLIVAPIFCGVLCLVLVLFYNTKCFFPVLQSS